MKKFMKTCVSPRLLIITLLLTLVLVTSQGTYATDNAQEYPGGVNYIEHANFTFDEMSYDLYNIDQILVKPNTQYTLTLHSDFSPFSMVLVEDWNSGNLSTYVGSFTNHGSYLSYTFTTGNGSFLNLHLMDEDESSAYGSLITDIMDYGELSQKVQLEEGSSFSGWSTYLPPQADGEPPLINGASAVLYSNVNSPYTTSSIISSLTATDAVDGDVTNTLTATTDELTGNHTVVGNYNLVITANDTSGNVATVSIQVRVVDTTDPVINITGLSTINLEVLTTYTEQGAILTDNYDSDKAATVSGTVNTSVLGTYTITYSGTDSNGNTATSVTRTVVVADTIAPTQNLVGPTLVYVEYGSNYSEQGTTVTDNFESGLSSTITGSVNVSALGTYNLSYNVSDSSGNAATTLTRNVVVRDTTPAALTDVVGNFNYTTYTDAPTSKDNFINVTATDLYDSSSNITLEYLNDTYTGNEQTVGVYTIDVKATDTSGNVSTQTITITVVDDFAPTLETTLRLYTVEYADSLTHAEIKALFND